MKYFLKRFFWLISALVVIILLAGLSSYLYYTYGLKFNNLKKENEILNQKNFKVTEDLKLKNAEIDEKNKEIEDLKQAKNLSVQSEVISDAKTGADDSNPETPSQSSSIYDQIIGSDEFKNRITAALDLLKVSDGEHYEMTSNQVETINEYNNYGGYQEKRNIYIGADGNPTITASLISHEAQHVYNVYVSGIWSYHTKEQELPCYESELVTAQRVGAPAFFITSVQNNINYWQAQ